MATIKIGQRVRDTITGFEGIVVARTEWLYGCVRLTVQSDRLAEGKPAEPYTVDEPQCALVGVGIDAPYLHAAGERPSVQGRWGAIVTARPPDPVQR